MHNKPTSHKVILNDKDKTSFYVKLNDNDTPLAKK